MPDTVTQLAEKNQDAIGLIPVASNSQIKEREDAALAKERAIQASAPVSSLNSFITSQWEANKFYRESSGIDAAMIEALNQRNSEYGPQKMGEILQQGGTSIFMGITGVKCRAAEAWLFDTMSGDRPRSWSLKPTPIPELPPDQNKMVVERSMAAWAESLKSPETAMSAPDVAGLAGQLREQTMQALQDDAQDKADAMEIVIADQLAEGGWKASFEDFIVDLTTLKAGIIKGPVVHNKKVLKWKKAAFGGKKVPKVVTEKKQIFKRVSPLDMYPSDGAVDINDGNLIERIKFSRKSLTDMRGLPGYDKDAINLALKQYGKGGLRYTANIDWQRSVLEDKGSLDMQKELIEGREFWGSVPGRLLIDRGIYTTPKGKAIKEFDEYDINAIQVGSYLIYVAFNADPLGRRPYAKTGWAKVPGSWWYKGIPELMQDLQGICNASIRALVNNLSIASGPQVVINDIKSMPTGEDITSLYPWKIWQFTRKMQSQGKQIDFWQPKSNAQELMGIYDFFARLADDFTGIPAYSYGNDKVAGAGKTASGLSMLMNAAARGLKRVIARIDEEVIEDRLHALYDHNMQYHPDDAIKGDVQIIADGALAVLMREQLAAQRMEFLQTVGGDPLARKIMGVEGYAELLRAGTSALQMEDDGIVPDKERIKEIAAEVKQEEAMAKQMAMQQQVQQQQAA